MKLITALLTAVLLFAAAIPLGGATMRADAAEGEKLHELWYITDTDDCMPYMDEAIEAGEIEVFHHEYHRDLDQFLIFLQNAYEYELIHDSYVIFELKRLPDIWISTVIDSFYNRELSEEGLYDFELLQYLEGIFGSWKDANCKILVVWGLDENVLGGNTGFLQYADMQVNTDVVYPFFYTLVKMLYDQGKYLFGKINGEYIGQYILMNPLFPYGSSLDTNNIFFYYFAYYFLVDLVSQGQYATFDSLDEVIAELNKDGAILDRMPSSLDGFDPERIIAIGNTNCFDPQAYSEWEKQIEQFRETSDFPFPVFIYNPYGAEIGEWILNGTPKDNIFYSGGGIGTLDLYLPNIIRDFVTDSSLAQYNNWPGSAPINFKPLLPGPNGWISMGGGSLNEYPFPWDL